jgi:hypothetical protein
MRRAAFAFALLLVGACVGDESQNGGAVGGDGGGGGDAAVNQMGDGGVTTDGAAGGDAGPKGPCTFGTSHFGDGCTFGP